MAKRWKTIKKGIEQAEGASERTKKRFRVRRMVNGKSAFETFETLEEAEEAVKQFKKATKKFGKLTAKYLDADWREYEEAKRHLPPGTSLVEAAIYFAARNVRSDGPETVEAATKQFLEAKKDKVGIRQYGHLKSAMNELNAFWASSSLSELNDATILQTLLDMHPKRSGRTINNYFNNWRNFFNWSVRRRFLGDSPLDRIAEEDLPNIDPSKKNPLTLIQAKALVEEIDSNWPQWALWNVLQLFLGFRESEARRFRYEWIQPKLNRVWIPGWFFDSETNEKRQGSKTKDDWAIYQVPPVFWKWFEKYGKSSGQIDYPNDWRWYYDLRPALLKAMGLSYWPHNCKKDSFCTFHMSQYGDAKETALILKHRSTERMWQSYLGTLVPKEEAEEYFSLAPKS